MIVIVFNKDLRHLLVHRPQSKTQKEWYQLLILTIWLLYPSYIQNNLFHLCISFFLFVNKQKHNTIFTAINTVFLLAFRTFSKNFRVCSFFRTISILISDVHKRKCNWNRSYTVAPLPKFVFQWAEFVFVSDWNSFF